MKMKLIKASAFALALCIGTGVSASIPSYLTQEQYNAMAEGAFYEDKGVVLENEPMLGYLVYKNSIGETITANYYSSEMVVEKQPYYEEVDRVGYIDEMFPYFKLDARDTTISQVEPGDGIFVRLDREGNIQYISAYSDYLVRYGKVHTWDMNQLVLEDGQGRLYSYKVEQGVPITKGHNAYTLGSLKAGEWVKVLVQQSILGEGIVYEQVKEIAVDPDSRVIEGVYRGEPVALNTYRNTMNLKNAQMLNGSGWGPYENIATFAMNPRNLDLYYLGNAISLDYANRVLMNPSQYAYAAVESFMGKDSAVKLNFQSKRQRTLAPSQVIYASPGVVRLLNGEQIFIAEDAIIVRDDRLIPSTGIMVGDTMQAVVTGENKLAAAIIGEDVTYSGLQIFRGRIREIKDYEAFEVETFSLLDENIWYYHPSPRTFAIDGNTKFINAEGYVEGGVNSFLTYGEQTQHNEVYTILVVGDQAKVIVDMPYTKDAVKGTLYETKEGTLALRDVYAYNRRYKRWELLSRKNIGATIELQENTMIVKGDAIISPKGLKVGDQVMVMLEDHIKDIAIEGNQNQENENEENENEQVNYTAPGYLVVVQ